MAAWRNLPLVTGDPAELLRTGVMLLEDMAQDPVPTLSWYRSSRPALVLGRGQHHLATRIDAAPVVLRHSGGGAVWLDPSILSLDVILPTGHPWLSGDVAAVFDRVGTMWHRALTALGVGGLTVADHRHRRASAAVGHTGIDWCYAGVGRGEVLSLPTAEAAPHGARKLVGLAQRRRRYGSLVQCGLLRDWDPGPAHRALELDPAELARLRAAAVGLRQLGADHSDARIVDAVVATATQNQDA